VAGEWGSAGQLRAHGFWLMKKCPSCNKPIEWENNPFRPFCSERCKLVDFSKWVSEEYRVPGKPIAKEEPDEDADQRRRDSSSSEFKL
jgi:endogenous inhibitor of DNA gyrase (YacG/DUF329 family)